MNRNIKNEYPDFATIEAQIRRARLERSLAVSQMIASIGESIGRGLRRVVDALRRGADAFGRGLEAERDRRAIEADTFLKRSVPRY